MEGKSKSPLYGRAFWRKRRKLQLRKFPLCRECWEIKKWVRAARVVDHIKPWRSEKEFFENELQSLCIPCHNSKSANEDRDYNKRLELTEIKDF